jgi:signal transduction histidine kinase
VMGTVRIRFQVALVVVVILVGIGLTARISHDLSEQRAIYQFEQAIWTPVETERQFILLQSMLHQIAARSDSISSDEYRQRRDISLGYMTVLVDFARDNPSFDSEQDQITRQLEQNVQQYWQLGGDTVPDRASVRQLATLIDQNVELSHRLANIRRQIAEAANVRSVQTIETARIVQIATVGLLLVAGGWFLRTERRFLATVQRQKALAEEVNQRLRAYMAQAEDLAIEQERIRVAREIHDGLGHHLNNIKIHIGVAHRCFEADRAMALDSVTTVKTEIGNAQRELRRAIDALVSDDFLAGALEDLFEGPVRDCKLAGIRTNLQVSGTPRALPEQVKHTFYRIGQEALSNIRQHSCAQHATMMVDYGEQCVRIIIEDDGIGIPTNVERRPGHGLDNLQERAALIGGKTDIETRPGQGVRVVVEVPA